MLNIEMMQTPLQVTNNVFGKSFADKICMIDDEIGGYVNNGCERVDETAEKVICFMECKIPIEKLTQS